MKKNIKEKYFCDICKKQIKFFNASNTFQFTLCWESGVHKGILDQEGHVCNQCIKSKLRRWLANIWVSIKEF